MSTAPNVIGTYVGEVNTSLHRALGCVGIVTDGGIRDVSEMTSLGFKALAARLCVGHAYAWPVRWNCEVEVFGCSDPAGPTHPRRPARLPRHARSEDEEALFDASQFMDGNECDTVIAATPASGRPVEEEMRAAMARPSAGSRAAARGRVRPQGRVVRPERRRDATGCERTRGAPRPKQRKQLNEPREVPR